MMTVTKLLTLAALLLFTVAAVYPGDLNPLKVQQEWKQVRERVVPSTVPGECVNQYFYINPDLTADVIIAVKVTMCPAVKLCVPTLCCCVREFVVFHILYWDNVRRLWEYGKNYKFSDAATKGWNAQFNYTLREAGITPNL